MYSHEVIERPMAPPKDVIYYVEHRFNGKTSEQIFQEDLMAGRYTYVGKERNIEEVVRYTEGLRLGGRPRSYVVEKIQEWEYDVYKGDGMITCHRNSVLINEWYP